MLTHFLRFPDEATAQSVFATLDLYTEPDPIPDEIDEDAPPPNPGGFITASHTHALDLIGVIIGTPGTYDPETGEELTPPVPLSGWHVNFACMDLPEALAPYAVYPGSPVRIFGGLDPAPTPDTPEDA